MKRIRVFALVLVVVLVVAVLMAKTMLGGVAQQTVTVNGSAPGATVVAAAGATPVIIDRAASTLNSSPTSAATVPDTAPTVAAEAGALSPEQQFKAALSAHKPTLALFHSLTCVPCKAMATAVEEVRPDYEGKVAFVDVDVYDTTNTSFCRSARVQMIPTTVLVNAKGEASSRVGAVEADQLRDILNQLLTATSS